MSSIYKKENLRLVRRHLGLTQKEFIQRFLTTDGDEPMVSVATFSNLEAKGGRRLGEIVLRTAELLKTDPMVFAMEPDLFAGQLDVLFPTRPACGEKQSQTGKKSGINQLINELTMYFAEQMLTGSLKKGDQIPSDRELASVFQVGRSAIREAMKVLDVLGLVDIRPGQGTYICNKENDFFVIPLSWSLFLNGNQIENIIAVRNVLEAKAAELAATCEDVELLHRLSSIAHHMQKAHLEQDHAVFLEEDLAFHICITECSGNKVIYSMIQTISNLMKHISGTGMLYEEELNEIYEEHQRIYGFILTHDAKAAREAMEEHLQKSIQRYRYR